MCLGVRSARLSRSNGSFKGEKPLCGDGFLIRRSVFPWIVVSNVYDVLSARRHLIVRPA